VLASFLAAGCFDASPPVGRWEGTYEDPALVIVARLEIDSAGKIRVSAPNATSDNEPLSEGDRADLRDKLEKGLETSWPHVAPLPLEFDGHAFHKHNGVAPQLEWDGRRQRMTLVFYSGSRRSVHVPLQAVKDFGTS